jgi:hypothetical protein
MVATYEAVDSSVIIDVQNRPLELRVQELERRLERGWVMIEQRRQSGENPARLEDHWIDLLNEYQALIDGAN